MIFLGRKHEGYRVDKVDLELLTSIKYHLET